MPTSGRIPSICSKSSRNSATSVHSSGIREPAAIRKKSQRETSDKDGVTAGSGIAGTKRGIAVSSNGVASPKRGIAVSSNSIAGPKGGIAVSGNGVAGPKRGIAVSSNGIAMSYDLIATDYPGSGEIFPLPKQVSLRLFSLFPGTGTGLASAAGAG